MTCSIRNGSAILVKGISRATAAPSSLRLIRDGGATLGWPYLEKLAKQKVMQVQSATDTPKKVLLGERAGDGGRQRI